MINRPHNSQNGFTLVELIVVVVIIGILVAVVIPQYTKTVETSKSDDAAATVLMIGTTNRMYVMDNKVYAAGQLTTVCGDPTQTTCVPPPPPVPATNFAPACNLIACKYLAAQDFNSKPYDFYSCNPATGGGGGCCANTLVACTIRNTQGNPSAPYNTWGYTVNSNGVISAFGTQTPAPPPS